MEFNKQNPGSRIRKIESILVIFIVAFCMIGCSLLETDGSNSLPNGIVNEGGNNESTAGDTATVTVTSTPTYIAEETPTQVAPTGKVASSEVPTQELSSNPSPQEKEIAKQAQELLDSMSLKEKVGQMFFARCPENDGAVLIQQDQFGGYLLFGRDFKDKTKSEVIQKIKSYQSATKIPLFIGVDEEGGTVTRISRYEEFRESAFESPQKLYLTGGFDAIVADTIEKAHLLAMLGINVNFAPVCDISTDSNDFMYQRSFGKDAALTSEYVTMVVETAKQEHLISVLKHFPGYGNNEDTHTGIAMDERSYETFVEQDFLPFQAGMDAGAEFVLVTHNVVNCMDDEYPASLSKKVHEILRNDLGFDGIIITDDLSMDAIGQYTGDSNAAVLAVLAGNDMLCSTNVVEQMEAVLEAVKNGTISEERIDESVLRILKVKCASIVNA